MSSDTTSIGPTGYGVKAKAYRCSRCNAVVTFVGTPAIATCELCSCREFVFHQASETLPRPLSMIPFQVDEESAKARLLKWQKRLWFLPEVLRKKIVRGDLVGIYLPHYVFDVVADTSWSALAGIHPAKPAVPKPVAPKSAAAKSGAPKSVGNMASSEPSESVPPSTTWEPTAGSHKESYKNLVTYAANGVARESIDWLRMTDLLQAVPYDPRLLAGWRVEDVVLTSDEAWLLARERVFANQKSRVRGLVQGEVIQGLEANTEILEREERLVLLPVWIAAYDYRDATHRVLIDGVTGKIYGLAPYSAAKIIAASVGFVLACAFVAYWIWPS